MAQNTNRLKMNTASFRGLKQGDRYVVISKDEMRTFERFHKNYAVNDDSCLKAVNAAGTVDSLVSETTGEKDMRWPSAQEMSAGCVLSKATTMKEDTGMASAMMSKAGTVLTNAGKVAGNDLVDAGWRTAAKEATKLAREPLMAFLKNNNMPGMAGALVSSFLDTSHGEAAFSMVLGWSLLYTNKGNASFARLSKELRVLGLEHFTTQVAEVLVSPIRDALTGLVDQIGGILPSSDDVSK